MPEIEVSGFKINFPFTPYECQVKFMESVLTAVTRKQNALLESAGSSPAYRRDVSGLDVSPSLVFVRWGGVTKSLEMGPYVIRAEWVTVTSITQQDTN